MVNSHFYKLLIGLETIIKTKIFVAIIIATKKGFNSITYYYFYFTQSYYTYKVYGRGGDQNLNKSLLGRGREIIRDALVKGDENIQNLRFGRSENIIKMQEVPP